MSPQERFFQQQLANWKLAARNYESLKNNQVKEIQLDDLTLFIQFNPERIRSSTAILSPQSVAKRPCFLCPENRPSEQLELPLTTVSDFTLLVNPYPVFERHYTLIGKHQPQEIGSHINHFLAISKELSDCVTFYNGPTCGASAPDHLHFQAGSKGVLPLEKDIQHWKPVHTAIVYKSPAATLYRLKGMHRGGWLMEGTDQRALTNWIKSLMDLLQQHQRNSEEEAMVNLLGWYNETHWKILLMARQAHRPACFTAPEPNQLLISPASVEMGGLIITVRPEDFDRISAAAIKSIYKEVSLPDSIIETLTNRFLVKQLDNTRQAVNTKQDGDRCPDGEANQCQEPSQSVFTDEPQVDVGIVSGTVIQFRLNQPFSLKTSKDGLDVLNVGTFEGDQQVTSCQGKLLFMTQTYDSLLFTPLKRGGSFELNQVTIGVGFHWERTEKQTFEGQLVLLPDNQQVVVINRVPVETYLTSVISSEMSATASDELLKAHAVISRSWILSQILQKGKNDQQNPGFIETNAERIRWYDREDHLLFDVCADDHCQRYQGITRVSHPNVKKAIQATRGQILSSENQICDARFSKCCGGHLEAFQYCWENSPKAYLIGKPDMIETGSDQGLSPVPDLRLEANAIEWIKGTPPAFCHTTDKQILSQVLNHYDQETTDYYRWTVSYSVEELSDLVERRAGLHLGEIRELIPLERGVSGRITRLKCIGSIRSIILGKELEIRRTLSETHLYSSAFYVEKKNNQFVLHGAGWGHGVGLCQIGAAVMGEQGYSYQTILEHYYPGAILQKKYE
jgi:SpoIID/LytB domain protein